MPRDPENSPESVQRQVERMFHDLIYRWHPSSHFAETTWAPPADLMVSEDAARVLLELAGVPRENVRVALTGRTLEVRGRRSPPAEVAGVSYHRAEIFFGDFKRVVELPWEADPESVNAIYRDGLLEIQIRRDARVRTARVTIEREGAR